MVPHLNSLKIESANKIINLKPRREDTREDTPCLGKATISRVGAYCHLVSVKRG